MRPVLPLPALQCTAATPLGCSCKKLCTCLQTVYQHQRRHLRTSKHITTSHHPLSQPSMYCLPNGSYIRCANVPEEQVQQLSLRLYTFSWRMTQHLMIIKRKTCDPLEFGGLVSKVVFRAQVVHTIARGQVLLLEEALHIPHLVPIQPCSTAARKLQLTHEPR